VTTQTRYIATLLATGAVAVAIGYAPVALADSGRTPGGPNGSSTGPATNQPSRTADDPPAPGGETLSGSDPLVPSSTGADPIVIVPPGYDLPS
jgi:hypothetical protein